MVPMNKIKLDLACGGRKKRGFLGVDIVDMKGVDIVCDLEKFPWTQLREGDHNNAPGLFDYSGVMKESVVDEVRCHHYIEHTPDLIGFMNELWRIMKPGVKVEFEFPYYTSIRAWQDPTHVRAISEATFDYFNQSWLLMAGVDHYPIVADFEVVSFNAHLNPPFGDMDPKERDFAVKHYFNVVSDLTVTLRAIK